MRTQSESSKKRISSKKTILPFIVHRAPIQNHIAYEKKGHWTQKEKLKYVIFLEYFKTKFTSRDKKKRFCRIFKLMADFIKTRTHNQCRSHHQKMEKQRFQVDNIIKNVVSKYHPRVYKQLYDRYRVQIENLDHSDNQKQHQKSIDAFKPQTPFLSEQDKKFVQILQRQEIQVEDKTIEKEAENSLLNFFLKNDELKHQNFCQPFYANKEARRTRAQDSDCEDSIEERQPLRFNNSVQNQHSIKLQQSLDFSTFNNFYNERHNSSIHPPSHIHEYLQSLEMRKMQSLNRASFHYNQMQIELRNVQDCQRQKQAIVEVQNQQNHIQKAFPFGFSNFPWEFRHFHKQC